MEVFVIGCIILSMICFVCATSIPEKTWCKWGFHQWMSPTYPYWGGCEQGTYCCDLRMKVTHTYKGGKCISRQRVPFTESDKKAKQEALDRITQAQIEMKFVKQLRKDMLSDDDCEELLP